jgi:hypothetical protein
LISSSQAAAPFEDFEDATSEYGLTPEEIQQSFDLISEKVEAEVRTGRVAKLT